MLLFWYKKYNLNYTFITFFWSFGIHSIIVVDVIGRINVSGLFIKDKYLQGQILVMIKITKRSFYQWNLNFTFTVEVLTRKNNGHDKC